MRRNNACPAMRVYACRGGEGRACDKEQVCSWGRLQRCSWGRLQRYRDQCEPCPPTHERKVRLKGTGQIGLRPPEHVQEGEGREGVMIRTALVHGGDSSAIVVGASHAHLSMYRKSKGGGW